MGAPSPKPLRLGADSTSTSSVRFLAALSSSTSCRGGLLSLASDITWTGVALLEPTEFTELAMPSAAAAAPPPFSAAAAAADGPTVVLLGPTPPRPQQQAQQQAQQQQQAGTWRGHMLAARRMVTSRDGLAGAPQPGAAGPAEEAAAAPTGPPHAALPAGPSDTCDAWAANANAGVNARGLGGGTPRGVECAAAAGEAPLLAPAPDRLLAAGSAAAVLQPQRALGPLLSAETPAAAVAGAPLAAPPPPALPPLEVAPALLSLEVAPALPPLEVAPVLLLLELPVTGNLEALEVLPTAEELRGELLAAQLAPDVVGVLRRFQARVTLPPPSPYGSASQPAAGPSTSAAATQQQQGQQPPHHQQLGESPEHDATPAAAAPTRLPAAGEPCSASPPCNGGGRISAAPDPHERSEPPPEPTAAASAAPDHPAARGPASIAGHKQPFEAEEAAGREREAEAGAVEEAAAGPGAAEAAAGGVAAATGSCPGGVDAAGAAGTSLPGGGFATVSSAHAAAAAAAAAPTDAVAAGPGCSGGAKGGGGGKGGGAAGSGAGKKGGGKGGGSTGKGGGGAAAAAGVAVGVEVDVVAQGGHCWIEVKNQEVFGLESVHWTGTPRVKGLKRQAEELLAVAAAPQHQRRWRAPSVVLFFPGGVHPAVRQELTAMGVHVALSPVPPGRKPLAPPPPPLTALDTPCHRCVVRAYRAAVQECLAAERAAPLMAELAPWMAPERPVLAADLARRQFQVLLDMFGGPREQARWASLQQRMTVVATQDQPTVYRPAHPELSERVRAQLRDCLGADQLAVFGLGDARRAITLTANGNAVRSAERQGVVLEVVLHRPVWLAGK
ncbi:hypothetical protein TSOC_003653 [Tetrabaena socialis]|uniref:DUF1308 domain-containing protein n=1 Tax=Tetrabaena socialis TaxID=47790 RepID=A0A2J8AAY6_9CHLO|nr:hypothetical protein TSOC_003653 [Tetrabaena socialis]|eukprot:PNH09675.1 hypothetical protein TSOC_003653 [Tetrabaena socialis]